MSRSLHPDSYTVLVPGDKGVWQSRPWDSRVQAIPGLCIYHFAHSMYYANAQRLADEVTTLVSTADPPLCWFCIDASAVDDIDYTAAETIRSLHGLLKDKGIRLLIAQVLEDVRIESSYHMRRLFGDDAFYSTLGDVMNDYQRRT